jgi:VWFA-related protein
MPRKQTGVSIRAWLFSSTLLGIFSIPQLKAQVQSGPADTPTFRTTTRLVFLDVTVLDRKGRPVVSGLSKDDFTITEHKQPQRIVSLEGPESHVDLNPEEDNPEGEAPLTILVLDLLNSRLRDFAYIRYQVRAYLAGQPEQLPSPIELMLLGNRSFEMVQGYTKNKADLLFALDHVPAALPFKLMSSGPRDLLHDAERFEQSTDALQQIALQNKGVPGRKNIIWVGHGAPEMFTIFLTGPDVAKLSLYIHDTTNMLVDARMSLFVIYPGLRAQGPNRMFSMSTFSAEASIDDEDDPFSRGIDFGALVNETGGSLFYNHNDIAGQIKRSQELGSEYYTLTYAPPDAPADGKFRRIRVTLRDPSMRALTKIGYFAPNEVKTVHPQQQRLADITEALSSTIPFPSLALKIENLVRHPDTRTVDFDVVLKSGNIVWEPTDNAKSTTHVILAAASLNERRNILAWRAENVTVGADYQDAGRLADVRTRMHLRLRVPRKTQAVRAVVKAAENGPIGAAEFDEKTLDAAPQAPTPEPRLRSRPPNR